MELEKKSISHEEALKILSFEIDNVREAQSKHGINHWVLYATLGSFFWLLTDSCRFANDYSLKNTLIIFILFSFFTDRCKNLKDFLGSDFKNIQNLRVGNIETARKYILVPILEVTAWIAALIYLKAELPDYVFKPFIAFSAISLIASLPVLMFASKVKSLIPPLGNSPINIGNNVIMWITHILSFLTIGTGFYLLITFGIFAYSKYRDFTYIDLRIGGLLLGILFILNQLVKVTDTKNLDSLKEIYRRLSLDLTDPETAISQMNVEVAGLTMKEHFQKNILDKLTAHLKNIEFILEEQRIICVSLKELVSKKEPTEEIFKQLEARIVDYCSEKRKLLKTGENFQKETLKIQNKFQMYRQIQLLDLQTVQEITLAFEKESARTKEIGNKLLDLLKTEVLPSINEYMNQGKIKISDENKNLLLN